MWDILDLWAPVLYTTNVFVERKSVRKVFFCFSLLLRVFFRMKMWWGSYQPCWWGSTTGPGGQHCRPRTLTWTNQLLLPHTDSFSIHVNQGAASAWPEKYTVGRNCLLSSAKLAAAGPDLNLLTVRKCSLSVLGCSRVWSRPTDCPNRLLPHM